MGTSEAVPLKFGMLRRVQTKEMSLRLVCMQVGCMLDCRDTHKTYFILFFALKLKVDTHLALLWL